MYLKRKSNPILIEPITEKCTDSILQGTERESSEISSIKDRINMQCIITC